VTDSSTPTPNTATANLSITINASASTCDTTRTGKESLLLGDYAFILSGFDSSGNPAYLGGVLTASGTAGAGNITAGTLDMNLIGGVQSGLSLTSASTYNLGQDASGGYRGCMTLVSSAGTQHYAFSVDAIGVLTANVASDGHMADFDTTGPFTAGILRQATPSAFSTAAITSNWAFGISGPQSSANGGGRFAAAGLLTFSSGTVSGVADSNDNGMLDNNSGLTSFPATAGITLNSGPYNVASNGRGAMAFTPSGNSPAVNSFLYVVSASEALILSADPQANNTAYIGRAFKQSGTFTSSSLSGNYVLYHTGVSTSTTGGSTTEIDLVNINGTSFTFSGYQNNGGSISDPTTDSGSGTLSVASNGRVLDSLPASANFAVLYLVNADTGFFLNSGTIFSSGSIERQTGSSFTNSSASGTYGIGIINPEVSTITVQSGDIAITPATTSVAVTIDSNSQGTLSPDGVLSLTYAIGPTGVGLLPSGCTLTGTNGNCKVVFVVVAPNRIIAMDATPANGTNNIAPAISILEQ
jgi:hypothetical protein